MVTNFTRFNVRSERPSPHIDWITVDDTTAEPQKALAHLETLSAFVAPLQHRYGLHVTHLSHFPANKEYAGRNYGKGEHVLVVLNDASGRWLSFRSVLYILLHELAHCRISSHGRDFQLLFAQLVKGPESLSPAVPVAPRPPRPPRQLNLV